MLEKGRLNIVQITVRQLLREGVPIPLSLLKRIEKHCSSNNKVGGVDIAEFMVEGTVDGLSPYVDKALSDYYLSKLEEAIEALDAWESET